jgi:hypothetical protein
MRRVIVNCFNKLHDLERTCSKALVIGENTRYGSVRCQGSVVSEKRYATPMTYKMFFWLLGDFSRRIAL